MDRTSGRKDATAAPVSGGGDAVRLGMLGEALGFYLRLAQSSSFRAFKRLTGVHNLRPGWFAVLSLISDNPGITPIALSRACGRDKSTITPILRDLGRERLIRREPVPNDRRSYALHLTPAGRETLSHLAECAAAHDRELDAIVGGRKEELITMLRHIVSELE